MKIIVSKRVYDCEPVYGGIQVDSRGQINFNWSEDDSAKDVMQLVGDSSGEFDEDNVRYIYGYKFNPSSDAESKRRVRNFLKHSLQGDGIFSDDVADFVDAGVLKIEKYSSFSSFGALVSVKSTHEPSLVDTIGMHIHEYARKSPVDFKLIKQTYRDVQFDDQKAYNALIANGVKPNRAKHDVEYAKKQFERCKASDQLFQMKRFVPREIRAGFLNFLKFRNEDEEEIYRQLQDVDVLLYDDFLTSGATVKEMVRCIRSIHDNNRLTIFVLVNQQ